MYEVIENLLLPAIGAGQLQRSILRDYLANRFPAYSSTKDCALAIVDALFASGIITADRLTMNFTYRDIKIPSFAFILHSEFPDPGMFDIGKIEQIELSAPCSGNPPLSFLHSTNSGTERLSVKYPRLIRYGSSLRNIHLIKPVEFS